MINELTMQRVLDLALKGKAMTSPNPMVGSIILKGGKTIAEGWHKRQGTDHAEVLALKRAGARAKGAALFVNLEPCFHHGRTPPCVDAIIKAGIKDVIIGMKDPNPLTNGCSIKKLRRAGIKVRTGVLEKEAKILNEVFIKYITHNIPFIVAKMAQTLDGKIATVKRDSKWITSQSTRVFARKRRNEFDAIMVGIKTVLYDDPSLEPARKKNNYKKIIVDSTGRISLKARLFSGTKEGQCIIATTKKAKEGKVKLLEDRGVQVIVCPQRNGRVDLKWLLKTLAKMEIASILLEGGAHLVGSALKEGLVDKCHIYVAPKILGDSAGLDAVTGLTVGKISDCIDVKRIKILQLTDDFLIEGYPQKKR